MDATAEDSAAAGEAGAEEKKKVQIEYVQQTNLTCSYIEEIVDIADPNMAEFNAIFTRFKVLPSTPWLTHRTWVAPRLEGTTHRR